MNLYVTEEMGNGKSYVAPDSHFISTVAVFVSSLPWERFQKFFENKRMVNLSGEEQLILLRLLALQELLCLDDEALLRWTKHQLYLFSFMQPDYKPRLPSIELLREFRDEFEKVGLLEPFRKQCHRLIAQHENRLPPIFTSDTPVKNKPIKTSSNDVQIKQPKQSEKRYKVSDTKVDLPNFKNHSEVDCPNCGSQNVYKLKPSQEASTLPNIRFSRCRFCGNTFRD